MLSAAFVPFNVLWLPWCPEKTQEEMFLTEAAKCNWIVHPKPYTKSSDLGTLTAVMTTEVII